MVLFRAPSKGQRSTTTDCHHTAQWTYELTAKEPWALVTNLTIEAMSPQKLVNIYQKRMQIEETFRDLKSPAYGFGLRHRQNTLCGEDGHTAIDSIIGATGILVGRIIRRNTAITAALPSQHGKEKECAINNQDGQRTAAATA